MKAKCKTKTAPMKPERKNEIVVYQPDEVMRLEVRVLDESVWLTQAQIAELFGTKRPAITKHLANIYPKNGSRGRIFLTQRRREAENAEKIANL